MSNEKIPWPGDGAIVRAGAFVAGWTSDRSGVDAIDAWASTATPDELDHVFGPIGPDGKRQYKKGRCYKLGHLHGLMTYPIWERFWAWLFGWHY